MVSYMCLISRHNRGLFYFFASPVKTRWHFWRKLSAAMDLFTVSWYRLGDSLWFLTCNWKNLSSENLKFVLFNHLRSLEISLHDKSNKKNQFFCWSHLMMGVLIAECWLPSYLQLEERKYTLCTTMQVPKSLSNQELTPYTIKSLYFFLQLDLPCTPPGVPGFFFLSLPPHNTSVPQVTGGRRVRQNSHFFFLVAGAGVASVGEQLKNVNNRHN